MGPRSGNGKFVLNPDGPSRIGMAAPFPMAIELLIPIRLGLAWFETGASPLSMRERKR